MNATVARTDQEDVLENPVEEVRTILRSTRGHHPEYNAVLVPLSV